MENFGHRHGQTGGRARLAEIVQSSLSNCVYLKIVVYHLHASSEASEVPTCFGAMESKVHGVFEERV